jgi:hypothetical protein
MSTWSAVLAAAKASGGDAATTGGPAMKMSWGLPTAAARRLSPAMGMPLAPGSFSEAGPRFRDRRAARKRHRDRGLPVLAAHGRTPARHPNAWDPHGAGSIGRRCTGAARRGRDRRPVPDRKTWLDSSSGSSRRRSRSRGVRRRLAGGACVNRFIATASAASAHALGSAGGCARDWSEIEERSSGWRASARRAGSHETRAPSLAQ